MDDVCDVKDCIRDVDALGFCFAHYERHKEYGTTWPHIPIFPRNYSGAMAHVGFTLAATSDEFKEAENPADKLLEIMDETARQITLRRKKSRRKADEVREDPNLAWMERVMDEYDDEEDE